MKYKDLSVYNDDDLRKTLCIGWLNHINDFPVGDTSDHVLDIIFELIKHNTIEQVRSYSPCLLCFPSMKAIREATLNGGGTEVFAYHSNSAIDSILLGSRVVLHKGADKNYIFPDLIWHYIKEHRYLPLQEFIKSIFAMDEYNLK